MNRHEVMAVVQRRFARSEPELANGFAEHTTMGAEAMLTLRIDPMTVLAWSERHEPVPTPADSALGSAREAIATELTDDDWQAVLRRHVGPLVAHLDAHLFHGLIRTAHAVRALHHHDDSDARHELAAGLAAWRAWASHASRVPGSVGRLGSVSEPAPSDDVVEFARRGAAAFVATPSIVTLHAVTAPMAFVLLAEHLAPEATTAATSVFARTHARHPARAASHAAPTPSAVPPPGDLASLAERWDAHPAKLVEAALRGHATTGDPIFLDAIATMLA